MSKDRYSNDHTIEVVGDTKTLTINRNVSIVNDLEVGADLTTDTLTTDELSATTVDVSGVSTLQTLIVNGTAKRDAVESFHYGYSAGTFTFLGNYDAALSWGTATAGNLVIDGGSSEQFFQHSVTSFPDGATITSINVYYKSPDASGYEVSMDFVRFSFFSGISTVLATVTATSGTANIFHAATTSGLSEVLDYNQFLYSLIIRATPAAGDLLVYAARISADVLDYS